MLESEQLSENAKEQFLEELRSAHKDLKRGTNWLKIIKKLNRLYSQETTIPDIATTFAASLYLDLFCVGFGKSFNIEKQISSEEDENEVLKASRISQQIRAKSKDEIQTSQTAHLVFVAHQDVIKTYAENFVEFINCEDFSNLQILLVAAISGALDTEDKMNHFSRSIIRAIGKFALEGDEGLSEQIKRVTLIAFFWEFYQVIELIFQQSCLAQRENAALYQAILLCIKRVFKSYETSEDIILELYGAKNLASANTDQPKSQPQRRKTNKKPESPQNDAGRRDLTLAEIEKLAAELEDKPEKEKPKPKAKKPKSRPETAKELPVNPTSTIESDFLPKPDLRTEQPPGKKSNNKKRAPTNNSQSLPPVEKIPDQSPAVEIVIDEKPNKKPSDQPSFNNKERRKLAAVDKAKQAILEELQPLAEFIADKFSDLSVQKISFGGSKIYLPIVNSLKSEHFQTLRESKDYDSYLELDTMAAGLVSGQRIREFLQAKFGAGFDQNSLHFYPPNELPIQSINFVITISGQLPIDLTIYHQGCVSLRQSIYELDRPQLIFDKQGQNPQFILNKAQLGENFDQFCLGLVRPENAYALNPEAKKFLPRFFSPDPAYRIPESYLPALKEQIGDDRIRADLLLLLRQNTKEKQITLEAAAENFKIFCSSDPYFQAVNQAFDLSEKIENFLAPRRSPQIFGLAPEQVKQRIAGQNLNESS